MMTIMVTAFLCSLPAASAAIPLVNANVAVTPKTIGRGQTAYIVGWVSPPPTVQRGIYSDYTFTITKPDGTKDTKLAATSNTDGTTSFGYVVDQVGTWSVILSWPGDDLHPAVVSPPFTWKVQEEAVPSTNPVIPVPSESWSWPIHAHNVEWYQISGMWGNAWHDGAGTNFNAYSKAPETAHVLWKMPWAAGGLIGGDQGAYDIISTPTIPVVAMGRMYYSYSSREGNLTTTPQHPVVVCLDLFTGKEMWRKDMPISDGKTTLASGGGGMAIAMEHSAKAYEEVGGNATEATTLVSLPSQYSVWMVGNGIWQIDPFNGECVYYNPVRASAAQGKGGGLLMDDDGNLYLTNYPSGNISKFNTFTKKIDWTIKTPAEPAGIGQPWVSGNLLLGNTRPTGGDPYGIAATSYDTDTGAIVKTFILANGIYPAGGFQGGINGEKVVIHTVDRYWYCYNAATGQQLWKSDVQSEYPWGSFNMYNSATAYGIYYQGQYDGYLYALDYNTGKLVWKFYTGDNTDVAPGNNIPWSQFAIADGKIYFATGEHTAPNPLPKGNTLFCLDALTGELIWKFYGFEDRGTGGAAHAHGISSGVMWYYNTYDGQLYVFGKGETTTTVAASPKVVSAGSSVVIEGTVLDQSPASTGIPALSDADQSAYMEYLHTQNQKFPTSAAGVTVFLQAMLSNGTVIDIWHAKTDIMGHYEYTWTPPTQDTYKILATFEGSGAYYSSADQCALAVGQAAASIDIPSANDIAGQVISQIPTPIPPSPVVVPTPVSAQDVAKEVLFQMPSISTMDMILVAVVAMTAIISVFTLLSVRKIHK